MKIRDIYQANFCAVEKWPTTQEEHTITDIGVEENPFSKKQGSLQIWACFDNEDLRYRINSTNAAELAKTLGDDTDDWNGAKVTICRVQGQVNGKRQWVGIVEAISAAPKGGKRTRGK